MIQKNHSINRNSMKKKILFSLLFLLLLLLTATIREGAAKTPTITMPKFSPQNLQFDRRTDWVFGICAYTPIAIIYLMPSMVTLQRGGQMAGAACMMVNHWKIAATTKNWMVWCEVCRSIFNSNCSRLILGMNTIMLPIDWLDKVLHIECRLIWLSDGLIWWI